MHYFDCGNVFVFFCCPIPVALSRMFVGCDRFYPAFFVPIVFVLLFRVCFAFLFFTQNQVPTKAIQQAYNNKFIIQVKQ